MKKVAIFVEGMTEQEFAVAFVTSLVGSRGLHFTLGRQWKGKVTITSNPSAPDEPISFYVLVIDCASDKQVKTQVREQYPSLIAANYSAIIGLRDVYPGTHSDIPAIQSRLMWGLPTAPVVPQMHLAVMEVEAWFLADTSHFPKIDETLTTPLIAASGFDLENQLASSWEHPAEVLHTIYRLANKSYMTPSGKKQRNRVQRTLRALSLDELYVRVREELPELDGFIGSLEAALFQPDSVNP